MGIGHTYTHIKPSSTKEPCGGSMGTCKTELAPLPAANQRLQNPPDSQYTPMSHKHGDYPVSGSDMEDGWQDMHSSSGESDVEVLSSSEEDNVLEMYFTSDAGSDLMDIDEYL